MITREQAEAAYAAGPEAVVTLLMEQGQQVDALAERVKELEARLKKNSRNSHKPPSSDGLARRRVQTREASGRRPGGQKGHPGRTLAMVAEPDRVVLHSPDACPGCGTSLEGQPGAVTARRQVIELVPKLYQVIEHQTLSVHCPHCQHPATGTFPEHVTQPVQYGSHLKGLALYLQVYQLLPYERTQELLQDVVGVGLCEGTLERIRSQGAAQLAPVAQAIRSALAGAAVVGFDETGVRLAGRTQWLHSASTATLTEYNVHARRGSAAMDELGLLPVFEGIAVHDFWASYFRYGCRHAMCGGHLLRELKGIGEEAEQAWARDMASLLRQIKTAADEARQAGALTLDAMAQGAFVQRYETILAAGLAANPPPLRTDKPGPPKQTPAKNLLDRLDKHRDSVLLFMRDLRVPFDNNQSERDLRMAKLQQKISGCFRSADGAAAFCRIRAYISTLRKQDLPILAALRATLDGVPLMPALT
jgi:transposase